MLVEEALSFAASRNGRLSVLEIGTGSGAISIALASELRAARVTATDLSEGALEVAQENARRLGFINRIEFIQGDLFNPVRGKFDLIISNPPYIPEDEWAGLSEEIKCFEPQVALKAGADGTYFHKAIATGARQFLNERGRVVLELGERQKEKIEEILAKEGYKRIVFRKDYAGLFRLVTADLN